MQARSDVLIAGGGPAGCAAARLLARWGHDVRLVTRPVPDEAPVLAESIPPSARKLWSVLGAQDAIEAAGFVRSTGNTVWWGRDARVEMFDGGERGWQVTNTALEPVLLDLAREAGATIERRSLTRESASSIAAKIHLDCTGRTGLLARERGERRYEPDLRTVALVGTWRRHPRRPTVIGIPDETHTLIESYADGWSWSVPAGDDLRTIAVMVDPRTTDLARGHGARDVYLSEVRKTQRMSAFVAGADLEGRPVGWDASMYSSLRYASTADLSAEGLAKADAGEDWLLVGDAGSFVDPISSAGVTKALASGWLAAVVAHTCLVRPAMRSVALSFFQAREEEVYAALMRQTRQFLGRAATDHAHPFWTDRGALVDVGQAPATAEFAPAALRRDPAVRSAFERIRAAPALALQPHEGLRIEPRPAVSGSEIVLERRLVTSDDAAGVRFVCDVDVVALVEHAAASAQVPDLYDACVRRSGPVALPDFLTALATAVARGWLVWR